MAWDKDKIRHLIGLCLALTGATLLYAMIIVSDNDALTANITRHIDGKDVIILDSKTIVKVSLVLGVGMIGLGILLGRKKFDIRNIWWALIIAGLAGFLPDLFN